MKRHPVLIAIAPLAVLGAVRAYRDLTAMLTEFGDVMTERARWHEADNRLHSHDSSATEFVPARPLLDIPA